MASKRRRSVPPIANIARSAQPAKAPVEASRPAAGKSPAEAPKKSGCDASAQALSFLEAPAFVEAQHAPAVYRLDASTGPMPLVQEKGEAVHDALATALGFPSPFLAVDAGDQRGVWQSSPPIVKGLGEDPGKRRRGAVCMADGRQVLSPAGLKNLGATCYLNSLLQYLFFNADFRRGLLRQDSNSEVVKLLQQVFILLLRGDWNVVDTSDFVRAAGLEAEEQEDATEFGALLLDWLEKELNKGGAEEAKAGSFIPDLFQGEVSQVLTCLEHRDHTFERREPFYELRATLMHPTAGGSTTSFAEARAKLSGQALVETAGPAGSTGEGEASVTSPTAAALSKNRPANPSSGKQSGGRKKLPVLQLEQLLVDTTFPDEMLNGANQYHCPKCDCKVDAQRSVRLAKPPPYLHVTLERYHYNLQKGEREKLNNVVSFPRRLQLPDASSSEAGQQVFYDCIGYLEHVSTCAHSGHYTATLFQDDPAVQSATPASEEEEEEPAEPLLKRRCSGLDAATGGVWWRLDDETVTQIAWPKAKLPVAAAAADGTVVNKLEDRKSGSQPAQRLESASAYLLLYRRSDYAPQHGRAAEGDARFQLPAALASYADEANGSFAAMLREHHQKSTAAKEFLCRRRAAVQSLMEALRKEPPPGREVACSVVPSHWLQAFLRGEDRSMEELLQDGEEGAAHQLAPVLYKQALLQAAHSGARQCALDPLAVWTGEVRLVPTATLSAIGGLGGIHSSLFLQASDALDPAVAKSAWQVATTFVREWLQIGKIVQAGAISCAEGKSLQAEGRGDEAVWVANRTMKAWQRIAQGCPSCGSKGKDASWHIAAMRAFLAEAHAARWGGSRATSQGASPTEAGSGADTCELRLLDGILCGHGLLGHTKGGCLVRRSDVVRLLQLSRDKELAYRALWPDASGVPRLSTGLPDGQLLATSAVCSICRGSEPPAASRPEPQRSLLVRQRYQSGAMRKKGTISIPADAEAAPTTGQALRAAVKEQLGVACTRIIVCHEQAETELREADTLQETVEQIIIEKAEAAEPREAAAFQGSIFRTPSAAELAVS